MSCTSERPTSAPEGDDGSGSGSGSGYNDNGRGPNSSPPPPFSSPPSSEFGAVLSALIGGCLYGLKIRLPHALVMTALFRRDLSHRDKLGAILRLSIEHATNLASFAALYKSVLAALKWANIRARGAIGSEVPPPRDPGLPQSTGHALIAGAVGGYVVWGRYSPVNYQIVLYLASRVAAAIVTLARERWGGSAPLSWGGGPTPPRAPSRAPYRLAAAAVWGAVMALFESRPESLHPSLRRSMDGIYRRALPGSAAGPRGYPVAGRRGGGPSVLGRPARSESATTIDFSIEDAE